MKSKLAFIEVELILRARGSGTTQRISTRSAHPISHSSSSLEDNQIGFFTVYDGSFDKYIADFTKNIGPIFDLLFKFTKGAPPSPCRKYLQEFIDFAAEGKPYSDWVLPGISGSECSGHSRTDRR